MSKNQGKRFENNFQKSCAKQNICCIRLVDSNKFDFGKGTRFTPSNVSDFICFDGYILCLAELKHTQGSSISFSFEEGATPMIKPKQIDSLMKYHDYPNTYSLLILDYADRVTKAGKLIAGGTYAIKIQDFVDWANSVDKCSININDCKQIGIEIYRERKKINYTYDIKSMLDMIK